MKKTFHRTKNPLNRPINLLVAGAGHPLETFIAQILYSLPEYGFTVTLASPGPLEIKSTAKDHISWLFTPTWMATHLFFWVTFFLRTIKSFWISPNRSLLAAKATWQEAIGIEKLKTWNRLLPYLGGRWDIIYFPFNSTAINLKHLYSWGTPTIVSCRGAQINIAPYNPKRRKIVHALSETFALSTTVHCVSQDLCLHAQKFGLEKSKSVIIRPGVNTKQFSPRFSPIGRKLKIISIGSLIWRKGYDYSLISMAIIKKSNIPFEYVIIGDGPDNNCLLYNIEDMDLKNEVKLTGHLPHQEINENLASADIYLLPSLSEGIANVALEAMACGLIVISSDCGGMRELIFDSDNGFLVPSRNPESIADRIKWIWKNPDSKSSIGSNAREHVKQNHNLEDQVRSYANMFKNTLR